MSAAFPHKTILLQQHFFAAIPSEIIKPLQEKFFFYIWNEQKSEVRWMCSFDTTEEEIHDFVKMIKRLLTQ